MQQSPKPFSWFSPWQRWTVLSLPIVVAVALSFSVALRFLMEMLLAGTLRADELEIIFWWVRIAVASFTFCGWVLATLLAHRFFKTITLKEQELEHAVRFEVINPLIHNLREPLAAATYNLDVLKDKIGQVGAGTDVTEHIRIVDSALQMVRSVMADLLTLGELHRGHALEHPQLIDLKELAWEVLNEFREIASAKRITVGIETPTNLPSVNMNKAALRKIFAVLLENAISYTPESGKISVRMVREPSRIVCSVRDTGIGIPKQEQELIFARFFRASNASVYKNVGTGAGLFIAQRIVKDFKGEIWFESEEGKGTAFYFSIPEVLQ